MVRNIVLLVMVLVLSACVSTRSRHGFLAERGETEIIAEVGVDTKDSVLARYGEPSVRPALNNDTWYYITTTTNARAFYNARTTNRAITAFQFDPQTGSVTEVVKYSLDDAINVNLVDRETPTKGKELSFWEQLMGSVGTIPLPQEPQNPGN